NGFPSTIVDRRTQPPGHDHNPSPTAGCRQDRGNIRLIVSDDGVEPDFDADRSSRIGDKQRIAVRAASDEKL
ncbi:MAG: hypothetical protein WAU05_15105, partial [Nitrospira sp.]